MAGQISTATAHHPTPDNGWLGRLAAAWARAKRLYIFLLPLRFCALAMAVVGFAFVVSDQGRDVIAALAENDLTPRQIAVYPVQRLCFVPLVTLLALQVWFWSHQLLRVRFEGHPPSSEFPRLTRLVPRLLGAAAYVLALAAVLDVAWSYEGEVADPRRRLYWLAAALVVTLGLFLLFCAARRRWLERRGHDLFEQKADPRTLPRSTRIVLLASTAVAIVFFLCATLRVQVTGHLGASAILLLSLSWWVSLGGWLVYVGSRARIPLLAWLFVFALVVSPYTDNHVVQVLSAGGADVASRPTVAEAFDRWYARLARDYPTEASHPVFVAAAEGGGIRAAYWTAAVLTALADDIPGFREHLFAISGVSGGALGATVFDALIAKQLDEPGQRAPVRETAARVLAYDALAPTLAALTQPDFVQRFVPVPWLPDRARALEGGWEEAWRSNVTNDDRFGAGFLAMMRGREDRMPSLLLNGTVVETGNRIIASNLHVTSPEFSDALDLFDAIGGDVRVSTAVDNSTRFTYVTPAGTLLRAGAHADASPLDCRAGQRCEHVIDGGYFENSGAVTAAEIVDRIRSRGSIQVRILVIRFEEEPPKPVRSEHWLTESLSPVRGLLATRDARGVLAVDQLPPGERITFTLVQHPGTVVFPLGWLLSARARTLIDAEMGPGSRENGPAMASVAMLLGTPITPDAVYEDAMHSDPVARKWSQ